MALKITRLEERIVLEAAAVDAIAAVDQIVDQADAVDPGTDSCGDSGADQTPDAPAADVDPHADPVQVLVVSSSVDQAEVLTGAAVEGVLTYVYDGQDGDLGAILADIQEMLGGQQADSIAFATHSAGEGGFELVGDCVVDSLSLATDMDLAAFWEGVGDLVAEGGSVDILACDMAGSDAGLATLDLLQDIIGHDVDASDDATGDADQGGDWILETSGEDLADTYFAADHLNDFDQVLIGNTNPSDPPEIAGVSDWTTYENTANAGYQYVNSDAVVVTDPDTTSFDGGVLTVDYSDGGGAEDHLTVKDYQYYVSGSDSSGRQTTKSIILDGSSIKHVVRSSSNPTPSITTIGTVTSSGAGGTALEITFNSSASLALVDKVVEAIAYMNDSQAPAEYRTLSYTLTDGGGGTSTAVEQVVRVIPQNDTPIAVDDPTGFSTNEDASLDIAASDLLANDSDPDGDALTITGLGTSVTKGLVTDNGDGTFTYDPNGAFDNLAAGATAQDTFTYTVSDGNGGTDTATVTITINGLFRPTANTDTFTVGENGFLTITAAELLANDTDIPAGATVYFWADSASGSYTTGGGTSWTYDPLMLFDDMTDGDVARQYFSYEIFGSTDKLADGIVYIDVLGENDAPVAVDDPDSSSNTINADADTVLTLAGSVLTGNDKDAEGDTLNIVAGQVTSTEGATVTFAADGTVTYDPTTSTSLLQLDEYSYKEDTFTYTVSDGNKTDTGTVTICVWGVNDPPTARDNTTSTLYEDGSTTAQITATGNLITDAPADSDPEGNQLWISEVTDNVSGTSITSSGPGAASTLTTEWGTLVWDIYGNYSFTMDNSSDLVQELSFGMHVISAFTYTLSDDQGLTSQANLNLRIVGANDAPVAVDDPGFATNEEVSLAIQTSTLIANDVDIDGDPLNMVMYDAVSSSGAHITYSNGQLIYDASSFSLNGLAEGETATDSFTYTIKDQAGETSTATVFITVTGVNDDPIARNDSGGSTNEDTPLTIDGATLLANDVDQDGDTLSIVPRVGTSTLGATVTFGAGGMVTYDPTAGAAVQGLAQGASATDTFEYTIADGHGGRDTATVTVNVTGVNDAPQAVDDTGATGEDSALNVAVANGLLANDTDPDTGDTLSITEVNGQTAHVGSSIALGNGLLVVNADGSWSFDPNGGYESLAAGDTAYETFEYTISDGHGGTDTAEVTVEITGQNDAPDAVDDSGISTDEDTDLTFASDQLIANDTDAEGDTLIVTGVSATSANGASVTLNLDGTITYATTGVGAYQSLSQGANSTDTFDYTISDGNGGTATATVTITINGLNDAPDAVDDAYNTTEDSLLSVAAPGVLANDADVDKGDTLSVGAYDAVSAMGATVTVALDGSFVYNPTASAELQALADGETATDTFTYTCMDSQGLWSEATVTITVAGLNDAPIAVPDAAETTENAAVIGNLITGNDVDVDHGSSMTMDCFTVNGTTYTFNQVATEFTVALGRGTLHVWANGDYLFNPGTGYEQLTSGQSALETFTYMVRDEHGAVSFTPATVTLTIMGEAEETAPPYTPGGLYLGWAMHTGSSSGHGLGGQGGGGVGGSIQGHGEALAQGLGLMNRDNPWGPAYPDSPFHIETYLENSDAAKAAFNDAVDGLPGVSQLTKVALKDFNADILDHLLGHDADVTLHDLQDLVHDLEQIVERMGPSEMAQFRGVLAVWVQSLKIQAAALADTGVDVQAILDQLSALEGRITLTA